MKRMVKTGLRDVSVPDIIVKVKNVAEAMDGNTHFPDPLPSISDYRAAIQLLIHAQGMVTSVGGVKNTELRNVALRHMLDLSLQMTNYVNMVGNGDEAILLSSGFPLRDLPTPVGVLAPPEDCKVTTNGVKANEVKFYHKGHPKRRTYLYQVRAYEEGMGPEDGWLPVVVSTVRWHVFEGLTSGQLHQFRVAIGTAKGRGAWSQLLALRPQ